MYLAKLMESLMVICEQTCISKISTYWILSDGHLVNSLKWYVTTLFVLKQRMSYKQFNFAWTHSQCNFCMNVTATSITHLSVIGTYKPGICHTWILLCFLLKFSSFWADFCKNSVTFLKLYDSVDIFGVRVSSFQSNNYWFQ